MGGTKGYRSYRGRTSKGKIALAVVLVLIILAAVGFLWLQEYIVYDADGNARLDLPWRQEASVPPAEEEDPLQNVEITVQEPEAPAELAAFSAGAAPLTRAAWQETWMGATMMSAPAWNAAAVTLKDSAGWHRLHGGGHRRGPGGGGGEQLPHHRPDELLPGPHRCPGGRGGHGPEEHRRLYLL